MVNIIILVLSVISLCGQLSLSSQECPRDTTAAALANRECRTYCEDKPCRSRYASCLCDGDCGLSCINKGQSCPAPNKILHGKLKLSSSKRVFQSKLTYTCDDGYELIGLQERICQGDEQWSGKDPLCILIGVRCEPPPFQVENGYGNLGDRKEFFIDETLVYKCEIGFVPLRQAVTETQCKLPSDGSNTGAWEPEITLSCTVKRCRQPPSIDNGKYTPESDVFTFGMHIQYVCDSGYFLEGDADSICLGDQTWSGSAPYCEAVECLEEVDDVSHGRVVMSGTYFRSFLTYDCDEGYLLRGEKHRWCSEIGVWDGEAPQCIEIDCGEPTSPRKGYVQHPYGTKWNDIITYACNEGASTINEFALTAKCIVEDNEARWSLPPPDCYDNCGKKQNYDMTYSRYGNTYKHGIEVVVTCRKGSEVYPVSDSKETKFEALCDDGIWKPDSTCVPARCSCTALPNSWLMSRKFTTKNCDRFHEHDSDLHLECHSDYRHLRKSAVLQCRRGDWKPSPNDAFVGCEKRPCFVAHLDVSNGVVSKKYKTNGYTILRDKSTPVQHGTQFEITCNDRYELFVGDQVYAYAELSCDDSEIIGIVPTCSPARCICSDLKELVNNVEVKCNSAMVDDGTKISLECIDGYTSLEKLDDAVCSYGDWRDINVQCYKNCSCNTFATNTKIPSVTISANNCRRSFKHNEKAKLDCSVGYTSISGSNKALCQDGKWTVEATKCYAHCLYSRNMFENGYLVIYDEDTNSTKLLGLPSTVSHDKKFQLVCNEGFYVEPQMNEGSTEIYCSDGKWNAPKKCLPDENISSSTEDAQVSSSFISLTSDITLFLNNTDQDAGSVTTNLFEPDQESNSGSDDYDISSESVIKPPVDGSCSVRKPNDLLANGSTNVKERRFSSGSVVKFRCTDIVQFKFLGESILMCENGYWNGTSPSCVRLQERQYGNYPMIKYTVSDGVSSIDDDGSLIISEGANLMLHCLWFKTNGQPNWVDLRLTKNVVPPDWNTPKNEYSIKILNIQKNDATNYTCKVMGKANSFHLKIVSRDYYSTTVNSAYITVEDHLKAFCTKQNDNHIAAYRYDYVHGIETLGSVGHGTKMTVTCRSGYEVLPTTDYNVKIEGISRCDDGRWNPDFRCEPARCMCSKISAHDLANKFMMTKDCPIAKDHGTHIFLDCMEGYQTSQELQIECKLGNWDLRKIQYRSCVPDNSACKFDLSEKPNLIAFLDGNIYTDYTTHSAKNLNFKDNTILKIRCKNPLEYKLVPSVTSITCRQGSWQLPRCQEVNLNDNLKIQIFTYTKPNYGDLESQYTDDGKIILPKNIEIAVFCSTTAYYRPTLIIQEYNLYKKLVFIKSDRPRGKLAYISSVSEKVTGNISCSRWNGYTIVSHTQEFIFSGICSQLDEAYLGSLGLQIVPGHRQSVYVEGDEIPIECLSNPSKKYYMLCINYIYQKKVGWQWNVRHEYIRC